jgi:hypothetical protein
LMGHDVGLKNSYTKPTPEQLLEGNHHNPGYIDAMEYLTINDENRLKRENELLRVNKSEIEQLKQQAKEYEAFKRAMDSMLKEHQDELSRLDEEQLKCEADIHELLSNPKYDHSSRNNKDKKGT